MNKIERRLRIAALCLLSLASAGNVAASGEVTAPNGEYKETRVDLKVAALGGAISVERSWLNGRWYFNPAWADLRFTYDALDDGSVKTIDRAGTVYESSGGLYVNDDRFFIRRTDTGWRWNDTFGNWVDYDDAGKIQRYGDRNDVMVHFVRNADGRIGAVKDHNEVTALTFHYTAGKVTRIVDRANRDVEYDWTGENLTTVTDVLGHEWTYTYDGNGQIKGGEDPEGREWSLTYLQSYRAVGAAVPVGVSFSGISGRDFRISRVATLKNEAGHTMRYEYDYDRSKRLWSYIRKFPSGRTEATVYNLEGRDVRQEQGNAVVYQRIRDGARIDYEKNERGLVTRREYDGHRNLVHVTHPDGTTESWRYHPRYSLPTEHIDARGTRTTHRYDERGNRVETIEAADAPEQRITTRAYNTLGQLTSTTIEGATDADDIVTGYAYDDFGNVDTIVDAEQATTRFTHHATGAVEVTTDGRNHLWTRTYDAAGRLTSSRNPLDPPVVYGYDDVGNRVRVTDAAGEITRYEYDGLDRLVKTIDAKQAVSTTVYDPDGRIISRTDASGQRTTLEYDARGREWKSIDGAGNVTETVYGTAAQALEGLVAAVQYPTYREEYKYDARGRRTQTVRVLDAERRETNGTSYDATGNVVSHTDPLGCSTLRVHDRRGRVVETVDAIGGHTTYAYDHADNLLSLTDAGGNVHRFTYDRRRRVLSESQPMGQVHRFRYDANGNLVEKTDARGGMIRIVHDDANRRVRVAYVEPSSQVAHKTVLFTYDARGQMNGYDDAITSAVYGYDEVGRRISETVDYGAFELSHAYTYHANGQRASMTMPDGSRVRYDYTPIGQLQRLSIDGIGEIAYADFVWRRPREAVYPGGLRRVLAFDALQRTGSVTIRNADDAALVSQSYLYDAAGNVTGKHTEHGSYHFTYDRLGRLTGADYPNGPGDDDIDDSFAPDTFPFADDTFAFDALGNRIADAATTGTTPWRYNANNELLDGANARYAYDADGSTLARLDAGADSATFAYDGNGRLVASSMAGRDTSHYYDPFGRRLWRKDALPGGGFAHTYFGYSDNGMTTLIEDVQVVDDTLLAQAERIIRYPGGGYTPEVGTVRNGRVRWIFRDISSFPMAIVEGQDLVTTRFSVSGQHRLSGTAATEGYFPGFLGQYLDRDLGLFQNRHRTYDPRTGRYLERDPLGLAASKNAYLYANANPVFGRDPAGLVDVTAPPPPGDGRGGNLPPSDAFDPVTNYMIYHYFTGGGEFLDLSDFPGACDAYMAHEGIQEKIAEYQKVIDEITYGAAGVLAPNDWFQHDRSTTDENYFAPGQIFAFGAGFDTVTFKCKTIGVNCKCATTACSVTVKRRDDFKDPLDRAQNSGGKIDEWSDEANPGGTPYSFGIDCHTLAGSYKCK